MHISRRRTLHSFAIGFALGALAIAYGYGREAMPDVSGAMVPAAIAAPMPH